MDELKISIQEDATNKGLLHHSYNKRLRILPPDEEIKASSVETQVTEKKKKNDDKIWESCCMRLSSKCIIYTGQFTISLIVLGICTIMLIKADGDCNKSSGYINIISFLLGKLLATVATST